MDPGDGEAVGLLMRNHVLEVRRRLPAALNADRQPHFQQAMMMQGHADAPFAIPLRARCRLAPLPTETLCPLPCA